MNNLSHYGRLAYEAPEVEILILKIENSLLTDQVQNPVLKIVNANKWVPL